MTIVAAIAGATCLSYLAGWAIGQPWLVPVFNTLAGYPFMVRAVQHGRLRAAIARMLVWAACMGVCATALAYARPAETGRLFLNAAAYEREMFAWVATGEGAESRPRQFLPQHGAHAAVFAGLSLATGSALSMPFGAVLMNYMGHYVGSLAAHGRSPWLLLAGWHPWSLVRITSFVILGVVLSGPVLLGLRGSRSRLPGAPGEATRWIALALAGLVLDILIKSAAAPVWRRLLSSLAGW